MSRCIELAKKGLGSTYPNPMVGCVIVHKGRIIGEGWHHKAGEAHAEINAIESVKEKSLLTEAVIYVSLEPCSHFGRTPPCSDRIISEGIPTVVIGSTDPNPMVSSKGIARLRASGCEVITGVLKDECDLLNKRFFTFQKKKRPYIFLKWAQSADGFIAPAERANPGQPVWISNAFSRQLSHKMRADEAAILVGTQTVIDDNPSLTTRNWKGASPLRLVLDRHNRIPDDAAVFDGSSDTIVLTANPAIHRPNAQSKVIDFDKPVSQQICDVLFELEIQSLIVEGGARTLRTFIDANLWDEAWVFEGTTAFGEGTAAPRTDAVVISEENIQGDKLTIYKNHES